MLPTQIDRAIVVNTTIVMEAVLLAAVCVSLIWVPYPTVTVECFHTHTKSILIGIGGGLVTVAANFAWLFFNRITGSKLPIFKFLADNLAQEVAPLVALLEPVDIILVGVVSGVCEEIFFRGLLQPLLGVLWSSVVFGLFHCCSNYRQLPYAIWFLTATGFFLGWIYHQTGCLWTPIIAHTLYLLVLMVALRFGFKIRETEIE